MEGGVSVNGDEDHVVTLNRPTQNTSHVMAS